MAMEPATTDVGVQETVVFEVLGVTFSVNVADEGGFRLSPEYLAVSALGELPDVGVYFTVQAPLESLQNLVENLPKPFVNQAALPAGEVPVTVALQAMEDPTV